MKLIQEVDFKPQDNLVVTFEKFRTFSTDYTVLDKEANEGKDPLKDEMATKIVKKQVKFNTQVAKVLAVPDSTDTRFSKLEIGDEVIVDFRSCMELDGYKDLWLVPIYKVIGKRYSEYEEVSPTLYTKNI